MFGLKTQSARATLVCFVIKVCPEENLSWSPIVHLNSDIIFLEEFQQIEIIYTGLAFQTIIYIYIYIYKNR